VRGSGFPPGTSVSVSYDNGRSTSTARVAADGRFAATVTANAILPGAETVTATDGSKSASAPFKQQL
jgi:hypothetical protein